MKRTILLTLAVRVLALLLPVLVAGCGGGTPGNTSGNISTSTSDTTATTTGSAVATLIWQELPGSIFKAAAAPGVATVRVSITGGDMTTMQQDYAAAAGGGTITGIPAGTNRTFTFQGLTAGNSVTHQGVVSGVTISAGQTTNLGAVTMLVAVAPAAPANLTALTVSSSRIDLAWTDSDQLETGFTIERKTGAGGTWAQIATVAANATSYSNTGLTANTHYYYRVKATNGSGDSAWSGEANDTTLSVYTVSTSVGSNGSISSAGPLSIDLGSNTSFTITPDSGYSIASASGCGGSLSGSTYTTGVISGNCTVTVTFAPDTGSATFSW